MTHGLGLHHFGSGSVSTLTYDTWLRVALFRLWVREYTYLWHMVKSCTILALGQGVHSTMAHGLGLGSTLTYGT